MSDNGGQPITLILCDSFVHNRHLVLTSCMPGTVFCCCPFAKLCLTFCNPVNCSTPGFSVLHYILGFAQTHVHLVSDAIQPSHLLLPSSPPALSLSQHQGLFQWVGCLHQVPKYWSFSFSISPSNEYSGLISFGNDWFDFLAVQGTLKSSPAPQFKSINSLALSLLYGPTLMSVRNY